jgi:hypothetical protein
MTRRFPIRPWRFAGVALLTVGLLALPGAAQDEAKPKPTILVQYGPFMQAGFRLLNKDGQPARITYSPDGRTSMTVVRIDDKDVTFGNPEDPKGKSTKPVALGGGKLGHKAGWTYGDIQVTQTVEIVKSKKGALDTALITFQIENKGAEPHKVGLRALVDTLMVENDGTPFAVVGKKKLIEDRADFKGKNVPDAVQVMEKGDLDDPGLVAYFSLKLGGKIQPPDRFSITHWQEEGLFAWDFPVQDIDGDSAVVLYWNPTELAAGASRTVGFAYGGGLYGQGAPKKKAADGEK